MIAKLDAGRPPATRCGDGLRPRAADRAGTTARARRILRMTGDLAAAPARAGAPDAWR